VDAHLPGLVVDGLQFGGVFDDVVSRRREVAEGVVAGGVAARAPLDLHLVSLQPGDAAHHVIDGQDVVGDMVQAWRARQEGQAMVPAVAAHEAHEVAEPVGDLEAQRLLVPGHGGLVIGRVHDDVADLHWDRLAACKGARGALLHLGRDLQGVAVGIEEPEAVAAAKRGERLRLADDLTALGLDLFEERVDVGARLRSPADEVDPLLVALPQADDIFLRRAGGGEIDQPVLVGDLRQPPTSA
jgi:hypothetical protein